MEFVLALIVSFFIGPLATVFLMRLHEIPIYAAIFILFFGTLVHMSLLYFGVGTVVEWLLAGIRWVTARVTKTADRPHKPPRLAAPFFWAAGRRNSFITWVVRQNLLVTYCILCLPFPYVPSTIIVALKLRDIGKVKKGVVLITSNLLRNTFLILAVYYLPDLVTLQA